jgi:F-type H+-transporting ATPase subunit alpha
LTIDLFNSGLRPAINVGISVSRVGGAAQTKAIKKIAGTLKLELAQFDELAAFSQFASDLDPQTQRRLERGIRVTEILKQNWEEPMPVEQQTVIIWAATRGYIDKIKIELIKKWEEKFLQYLETAFPKILIDIRRKKEISQSTEDQLQKACETFNDANLEMQISEE